MSKGTYYSATIEWADNGNIQDAMLFKIGEQEEDDDVFFYLESEDEIDFYKIEGNHEWHILSIDKL